MDIRSLASAKGVSSTISAITSSTPLVGFLCVDSDRRAAILASRSEVETLVSWVGYCGIMVVDAASFGGVGEGWNVMEVGVWVSQ